LGIAKALPASYMATNFGAKGTPRPEFCTTRA
jgi:hypothetical protein